jgi:hypothetical protein
MADEGIVAQMFYFCQALNRLTSNSHFGGVKASAGAFWLVLMFKTRLKPLLRTHLTPH